MSRTRRAALIGFAQGALQGFQQGMERKRLEEARAREQQMLQEIRQRERAEDRQFQRETLEINQQARQAERVEDRQFQRENMELQLENQRALIREQAKYREPANTGFVEYIDAEGRPGAMTREEFARLPPEQRQGWTFRGDPYSQAATPIAAPTSSTTTTARPQTRAADFVYDPKSGLSPKTQ